ncbi:MAG: phosphoribosyltransferase family protein [Pirellulaceae bacterium]
MSRLFYQDYLSRQAGWMRCSLVFTSFLGRQFLTRLLDLLFPPQCSLCSIPLEPGTQQPCICRVCQNVLSDRRHPNCPRCARPLPDARLANSSVCPTCKVRTFRFSRALALGVYCGALREAVLRIKRLGNEPLTLALGSLLAETLSKAEFGASPDLLVPVPAHWSRRLQRGCNAPDLLAEAAAGHLHIPVAPDLVVCRRKTRKQGILLPSERLRNVRGAFAVSAGYVLDGAHVLVVDDVMTTGATANEIAKILLRAGASEVSFAVVARGIGFD